MASLVSRVWGMQRATPIRFADTYMRENDIMRMHAYLSHAPTLPARLQVSALSRQACAHGTLCHCVHIERRDMVCLLFAAVECNVQQLIVVYEANTAPYCQTCASPSRSSESNATRTQSPARSNVLGGALRSSFRATVICERARGFSNNCKMG